MSRAGGVWVGTDPGGKGNFGVAVIQSNGSAHTCCVDCADEAVEAVIWMAEVQPSGVGVDAPLWWSSGISGGRLADQWLRDTYGLSGGQVQAANSLQGAALVQGAMFVVRIRERFSDLPVTETHPKALLVALALEAENAFFDYFGIEWATAESTEHERDALISAVAAREGFEGRWTHDLSDSRYPSEQSPSDFWLGSVRYLWPTRGS